MSQFVSRFPVLIYLMFLATIPFGIRTTLVSHALHESPNPFLSFFLYHLDLLAILLIGWGLVFHVKHCKRLKPLDVYVWIFFFLFIIWNIISIFWTPFPELTVLSTARFFFGGLLITILGPLLRHYWNISVAVFLSAICLASVIAIVQVLLQHDLGVSLFSEAHIDPQTTGVAKVEWGDQTIVRGYGFFPHPNILGFSIFSGLAALCLHYISRMYSNVPRGTIPRLGYTLILGGILGACLVDHYIITSAQAFYMTIFLLTFLLHRPSIPPMYIPTGLLWGILSLLFLGGIASWSHAMIPFICAFIGIIAMLHHAPHTLHSIDSFLTQISIRRWVWRGGGIGVIIAGIASLSVIEGTSLRVQYMHRSLEIIMNNLWTGVGLHQYVYALPKGFPVWQYEPVHNVFFLILAETGIIGSGLLIAIFICSIQMLRYRL